MSRGGTGWGEGEGERENISQAGHAVNSEPDVGLDLTSLEIMT